jgi:hypothetical protein
MKEIIESDIKKYGREKILSLRRVSGHGQIKVFPSLFQSKKPKSNNQQFKLINNVGCLSYTVFVDRSQKD